MPRGRQKKPEGTAYNAYISIYVTPAMRDNFHANCAALGVDGSELGRKRLAKFLKPPKIAPAQNKPDVA